MKNTPRGSQVIEYERVISRNRAPLIASLVVICMSSIGVACYLLYQRTGNSQPMRTSMAGPSKRYDQHFSQLKAEEIFAGYQRVWGLPSRIDVLGGDVRSDVYFDTVETWYRFDLSPSAYTQFRSELSTMSGKIGQFTCVVEIGIPNSKFDLPSLNSPPWWIPASGGQIDRFKIAFFNEPIHSVARKWWMFYDPLKSSLFIYVN